MYFVNRSKMQLLNAYILQSLISIFGLINKDCRQVLFGLPQNIAVLNCMEWQRLHSRFVSLHCEVPVGFYGAYNLGCLNRKIPSYKYRNSRYKYKMVSKPTAFANAIVWKKTYVF